MSTEKQRAWIGDIIANIDKIERYVIGMDFSAFERDEKTIDAVERCLQKITEVAHRLQDQAEAWMPSHNWKQIRGLGNHLRHQYDTVQLPVIWQIIELDLPALKHDCAALLERLEADDDGASPK